MNNSARPSLFRRFFRWLFSWRNARRALIVTACLITLIVAAYVVEGWRGRRAWAEVDELARRRGEDLTVAALVVPPLPDEENFAATPPIADLFSSDAAISQGAAERWTLPQPADGRKEPGFNAQKDPNVSVLDAWRAYLGTDDLLKFLERYAADLTEISDATLRPHTRFPVRYEDGLSATLPHVGPIQKLSRILRLRAEARLERGLVREAAGDVATLFRLTHKMSEERTLVSQLVARSIVAQTMPLVGAGLADGAWSDADLTLIGSDLARLDLVSSGWCSFRGELAGVSTIFMQMAGDPEFLGTAIQTVGAPPDESFRVFSRWIPSGWIYQNAARVAHLYLDEILPAYDQNARRVDFARLKTLEDERLVNRRLSPYRVLADMLMPAMHSLSANLTSGQTQVDMARIAIELDRWKTTHGAYPETLAELSPAVTALKDYATGESFRYRRDENGTYLLYATGADGVDDGGAAMKGRGTSAYAGKGDWVWMSR